MELNLHRAGSGPPLVLIHGIGSRWQVWNPVLPRLEAERDVIALDLPGFGESPMPAPGTPAGIPSLVRLVSEFLDELGLDRPHVAGNSLGGWIALELAKRGRVSSATGLSPAGFARGRELAFARTSLKLTSDIAGVLAPRAERVVLTATARRLLFGQIAAKPARIPPEDAALHLRGIGEAPWFDDTLIAAAADSFEGGELGVPVTIAWGERDRVLLPRQAQRAQRLMPSARVLMLERCGHVPTYDDPERVAAVLLEGSSGPLLAQGDGAVAIEDPVAPRAGV
jgi:pimeloyl-ACP methyl ester carboxylesterase